MAEIFLQLPSNERAEIIATLSTELGYEPQIVEKDIWICWVLQKLFSMPDAFPMAFKGGTSLSKVFNIISRFSEDIDLTIDYRAFNSRIDPFSESTSKTMQKKLSEQLKEKLDHYLRATIHPYLEKEAIAEFGKIMTVIVENEGICKIHYPSVLKNTTGYIASYVLLEFGARNVTQPNDDYVIKPYIADLLPALIFPRAEVTVLSPARTFWEKATLIHVECNRGQFKQNASRLSRHWYDLVMLAQHDIGKNAITNLNLLAEVVKHKSVFFNTSYAHYQDCLNNKFHLLPSEDLLAELKKDYQQMILSGMFYSKPMEFVDLMQRIKDIENIINGI